MSLHILILGRAITLTTKWHQNKTITLTNIYIPNNHMEHSSFWEKIQTKLDHANLQLDILMGDFNIVNNPIDRAPT